MLNLQVMHDQADLSNSSTLQFWRLLSITSATDGCHCSMLKGTTCSTRTTLLMMLDMSHSLFSMLPGLLKTSPVPRKQRYLTGPNRKSSPNGAEFDVQRKQAHNHQRQQRAHTVEQMTSNINQKRAPAGQVLERGPTPGVGVHSPWRPGLAKTRRR